jgi:septal ring factor EnvC (AmiA/AmiB activator)
VCELFKFFLLFRLSSKSKSFRRGPVSKGQEEQKQEKDSLEREVTDLKTKLAQAVTAYDELERKNMATGAKVDTMAQHLEVIHRKQNFQYLGFRYILS